MYYYKLLLFLFRCLVSERWFRQRLRETTLTETMASAVSHKPVALVRLGWRPPGLLVVESVANHGVCQRKNFENRLAFGKVMVEEF